MSRDGSTVFIWGDGEHAFRLPIGQLRELQEKCDAGPAHVLERLQTGRWYVDDIREPIRLGLIGGGMAPTEAAKLVARYVDARPLLENVPAACAVIMVALVGAEDEPPGKAGPAGQGETTPENSPSKEASSASPASTEPAPQ